MNEEQMVIKKNKYWLSETSFLTAGVSVLAIIGITFALYVTKSIMIPFVLSLFLYFTLVPVRFFFTDKLKFPNFLALTAVFIIVCFLLGLIFFVLFSAIQEFAVGYKTYEAKAIYFADSIQDWLYTYNISANFEISNIVKNLPVTRLAKGAGFGALTLISNMLLVFIFLIFLFTGGNKNQALKAESSFGKEVYGQLRKYIGIKLITSSATAIVVFIMLSILGLDLAFLFALLVFILNFIPTIGSIVATFLPLPVAFFQYDDLTSIILVLALPGAAQFIIGSFLEPKFMGQQLNLHPITVLISLMFWGLIWGVAGAFMAVPIMVVIKATLTKIEGGKIINHILAGNIFDPTET